MGTDTEQFPTLADFENDGRAVLSALVISSPWKTLAQALASLTIFAHPDVVVALGERSVFRTIRGTPKGTIDGDVMLDDNASPATAFQWATGLKIGKDLNCNHLYSASQNPAAFSDVRNIFYAPNFISKLTDSQKEVQPSDHLLHILKYRAYDLYGYCGPDRDRIPHKPSHYDDLKWACPIGRGARPEQMAVRFRHRMTRRPKDRLAKSARLLGWTFSDYQPDPSVAYVGSPD